MSLTFHSSSDVCIQNNVLRRKKVTVTFLYKSVEVHTSESAYEIVLTRYSACEISENVLLFFFISSLVLQVYVYIQYFFYAVRNQTLTENIYAS